MSRVGASVSVELEVPFHDVDAMFIVWHGHYYKYFELARTALMRSRGLDVREVVELGYRMVVIDSACRHTYPLRYGDLMRVEAWFKDVDYRLNVAYEITNLSAGRRTAKGHTVLATLDSAGNLLLGTPDAIAHRLQA